MELFKFLYIKFYTNIIILIIIIIKINNNNKKITRI